MVHKRIRHPKILDVKNSVYNAKIKTKRTWMRYNETVDLIRNIKNLTIVKGNHERYMFEDFST